MFKLGRVKFTIPRIAWHLVQDFDSVWVNKAGMVMQFLHKGADRFFPRLTNPSNTTCIYWTLKFIIEHARRHDLTPTITFDQPLSWKALMIITTELEGSDLKGIVLCG